MFLDPVDWKIHKNWGFRNFEISWITRVTDPSVQTSRTMISLHKPHMMRALRPIVNRLQLSYMVK